ncbi:MAG: cytochrome c [Gemmatimonadaceae bacterium]|nr:cytochrome c [Gemmatimonadaceae bacterium]
MTRLVWTSLLGTCMVLPFLQSYEQERPQNGAAPQRSTAMGVYSREQWMRGRDVYAGQCAGCHPAVTHVGPIFTTSWAGKRLSDLFGFIRERMPKNDPGSLSEEEYVDVITYLLRLNGMPVGLEELPADSATLSRIRIDSSRVAPPARPDGR